MCSVFDSSLCYHLSHLELKGKIYEQRLLIPVADPDHQIREGGGVVSPQKNGGWGGGKGGSGPQFGLKMRGGPAPRAPPLDPPPDTERKGREK